MDTEFKFCGTVVHKNVVLTPGIFRYGGATVKKEYLFGRSAP
jgi:hypothetical protein